MESNYMKKEQVKAAIGMILVLAAFVLFGGMIAETVKFSFENFGLVIILGAGGLAVLSAK